MKKNLKKLLALSLVLAISGCGTLFPKKVEFGQAKVKPVPIATDAQNERTKEAAYAAELSAKQTVRAAAENQCPVEVTAPAKTTEALTSAVSISLGPPKSPYKGEPEKIAAKVVKDRAKLEGKINEYREDITPYVGKKIEGTGWFQIGYFTYLGCILGLLVLLWIGLKIYGMVNPVVGLGVNTVGRIASSVVSQGFSEVVKGGEAFKSYLETSPLTDEAKAAVLDLFTRAQKRINRQRQPRPSSRL